MKAKDILLCPTCKHHVLMPLPLPQHVSCPCDLLVRFRHSRGGRADALSEGIVLYSFIPQIFMGSPLCARHCAGWGTRERPVRPRGCLPSRTGVAVRGVSRRVTIQQSV